MLKSTTIPRKSLGSISQSKQELDKVSINLKSHNLLNQLLRENPDLNEIMKFSKNEIEALERVKTWIMKALNKSPEALEFYQMDAENQKGLESIKWSDYASIRLLDYINNAGRGFEDLNLRGEIAINNPIKMIWLAAKHGTGGAKPYFFEEQF